MLSEFGSEKSQILWIVIGIDYLLLKKVSTPQHKKAKRKSTIPDIKLGYMYIVITHSILIAILLLQILRSLIKSISYTITILHMQILYSFL